MRENFKNRAPQDNFEEKLIQLKRVSKKTKGGNKMGFSALVVVGDRNGKIGFASAKGLDVQNAIAKASAKARRVLVTVPFKNNTVPYEVEEKFKASMVKIMPAPEGSGIIAGGAVRDVLDLAGFKNVSAKMLGSNNKSCVVSCTIKALSKIKA